MIGRCSASNKLNPSRSWDSLHKEAQTGTVQEDGVGQVSLPVSFVGCKIIHLDSCMITTTSLIHTCTHMHSCTVSPVFTPAVYSQLLSNMFSFPSYTSSAQLTHVQYYLVTRQALWDVGQTKQVGSVTAESCSGCEIIRQVRLTIARHLNDRAVAEPILVGSVLCPMGSSSRVQLYFSINWYETDTMQHLYRLSTKAVVMPWRARRKAIKLVCTCVCFSFWGEPQASPTVTCWLNLLSRYIPGTSTSDRCLWNGAGRQSRTLWENLRVVVLLQIPLRIRYFCDLFSI